MRKPTDRFPPRKTSPDGLHGWCRPCFKSYYAMAGQRWRENNRERQRANSRRLYAENPERGRAYKRRYDEANREVVREAARRYYWENREESVERARRYREANREKINERRRRCYAANPAPFRAKARRRHKDAKPVSPEAIRRYEECLTEPCAYCGSVQNIEVDHIFPVAQGGLTVPGNLTAACLPCNRSKGDKLLSEWKVA